MTLCNVLLYKPLVHISHTKHRKVGYTKYGLSAQLTFTDITNNTPRDWISVDPHPLLTAVLVGKAIHFSDGKITLW